MALAFICVLLSGSNVVTTLSSPPFRMSVHLCPCTIVRPGLPFSCLRKLVDAALIPHTFLSTWTLARAASQAARIRGSWLVLCTGWTYPPRPPGPPWRHSSPRPAGQERRLLGYHGGRVGPAVSILMRAFFLGFQPV